MDITKILCMMQSAKNAAEEILMSQTKEELHTKIESTKQCIEQDRSISDIDKEFLKNFLDILKKWFEAKKGW